MPPPGVGDVLDVQPDLVLDNGADLITGLLARRPREGFRGATEETTTGGLALRALATEPGFPIIVINDSRLKLLVENRFGVGQSVVQGFMNATNLMIPSARATVVGYGPCGRGVAQTLHQLGARVAVVDIDPFRAVEALMEGFEVADLADVLPATQLLFLATGSRRVIGVNELELLPDGAVIAGVSHRAEELDAAALGPAHSEGPYHRVHRRPSGRLVSVLTGTRMINLTAALGNPVEAMDLGLTLQIRSLAAIASGRAAPGVHPVPDSIDRLVARGFVAARSVAAAGGSR